MHSAILLLLATIEWNLEHRGRLQGSGCDSAAQDTFLVEAGDQFFVVFTQMNARLDEGDARRMEVTCTGSVPVAVHGDRYLDRLDQTLGYGWSKSSGATARIAVHNKWYGRALAPLLINLQSKQNGSEPFEEITTRDDLRWGCKPNDVKKGTLDLDFNLVVQRSHPTTETVEVNLIGQDMRYTAVTVWRDCPH